MPEREIYPKETIELVASNVARITVATKEWAYETPNFYLLERDGEGVVIDSGRGSGEEFTAFLGAWEAFGKPKIKGIVISHHHYDHKSGGSEFADLVGSEVIGGDETEQELQELSVGSSHLLIHPTPGHTQDSVSAVDLETGSLFTGDTIVAEPSSVVNDMSAYSKSLAAIKKLDPANIFPGHGRAIYEPKEHIERYIKRVKRREGHVIKALQRGLATVEEVARSVYPQGVGNLETTQVKAHLQKLVDDGFVVTQNNSYRLDVSPVWKS